MVQTPRVEPSFSVPILAGPTASGKTALAFELCATHPDLEIINADSLLVYRELNIGTAKPTLAELKSVRHHLIDIRNPDETFTAGDFLIETAKALKDIEARNKRALIVGGTGFYLKALLYGMWEVPASPPELREKLEKKTDEELVASLQKIDPKVFESISVSDRYRLIRALEIFETTRELPSEFYSRQKNLLPHPHFTLFVIDQDDDLLFSRIELRTRLMIEEGILEETELLLKSFPQSRCLKSVGYEECVRFLKGEKPSGRKIADGLKGLEAEINLGTRQLVKKQRTWFRGEPASNPFKLPIKKSDLMTFIGSKLKT